MTCSNWIRSLCRTRVREQHDAMAGGFRVGSTPANVRDDLCYVAVIGLTVSHFLREAHTMKVFLYDLAASFGAITTLMALAYWDVFEFRGWWIWPAVTFTVTMRWYLSLVVRKKLNRLPGGAGR
jgi:hypothetical protein